MTASFRLVLFLGLLKSATLWGGDLSLDVLGTNALLSWPSNAANPRLQATGCNPFLDWTNVIASPVLVNGRFQLLWPLAGECQLFRLSYPTLNHVLIVGQSLALGAEGYPVLSSNQPYHNQKFVGQRLCEERPDDLSALVPLIERRDPTDSPCAETIASGFANAISARTGLGVHDLLMSNCGQGGTAYEGLRRLPEGNPSVVPTGTAPYLRGLSQVAAGQQLAAPSAYAFRAILSVHGESDALNEQYDRDIRQWQTDYQADIQRITGQTELIPMFHSQISAWSLTRTRAGTSPFLMLQEYETHPQTTVLVCPKYVFPYSDGLHLTAEGYRWLGEYYAKAYYQTVIRKEPWSPLRPLTLVRTNDQIDITFTGVVGHLVLDTNLVSNPEGDASDPNLNPCGACLRVAADPATDEFTYPGHSLAVDDIVLFYFVNPPIGLEFRLYWVTSIPGPDRFKVSAQRGGPPLDITNASDQVAMYWPSRIRVGPYGFEFFDSDGSGVPWRSGTWITKVELTGATTVRLTLNRAPVGGTRQLRYAYSGIITQWGGPETGARGCLRDTDSTPSLYGHTLYNWSVHFDKPCP